MGEAGRAESSLLLVLWPALAAQGASESEIFWNSLICDQQPATAPPRLIIINSRQILAFNYLAQEQVHLLTRVGRDLDAFGKASTAGGASAGEASATAGDAHVARGSSRGGAADAEGEEISSILGEAAAAGDLGVVSHAHGSGIATEYDTDIFFGAPSPVPSPTVPKT